MKKRMRDSPGKFIKPDDILLFCCGESSFSSRAPVLNSDVIYDFEQSPITTTGFRWYYIPNTIQGGNTSIAGV